MWIFLLLQSQDARGEPLDIALTKLPLSEPVKDAAPADRVRDDRLDAKIGDHAYRYIRERRLSGVGKEDIPNKVKDENRRPTDHSPTAQRENAVNDLA